MMNINPAMRSCAALSGVLLLLSAAPVAPVNFKLNNGSVFSGDIISQNDLFIIIRVGSSKLSIAKTMVSEVTGLPAGTTLTNMPSLQAPQPAVTAAPPPVPVQAPAETPGSPAGQPEMRAGDTVEIRLKNGSVFTGCLVTVNERQCVLQAQNGSRINIFRQVIAGIRPLSRSGTAATTSSQAAPAAPLAPPPQPPVLPVVKTPAAAGVPAAPVPERSVPAAAQRPAQQPQPAAAPASAATPPVLPVVKTPAAAGVPAAPVPERSVPAAAQRPAQQPQPAAPAVPAPAVQAQPAPPPPPPVIIPKKRADGKSELVLKTGTVFIGTVVSESERFLVFSTSAGTTINVLRRLIKTIDGVPYVVQPAAGAAAPADTSAQLQRTAAGPSFAGGAALRPAPEEKGGAEVTPRSRPRVDLKPGVSVAELADSLKSNSRMVRSVAARQLSAMGQWAASAMASLVSLLSDTAGAAEMPPIESDSESVQKLLPPGFEAGRALSRMGDNGFDELRRSAHSTSMLTRLHAVFGLGEGQNAAAIPLLREAQRDNEPRVRAIAAHGLRFRSATADLIAALNDRDGDVRTAAAATLAELRDPGSAAALIGALKDVRFSVRVFAAAGLGAIKAGASVAPLIAACGDLSPEVRTAAAAALGEIADTAAVMVLCSMLKEKVPAERRAAAEALGEIRDPRAIPSLYSALDEPVDSVKSAVEKSLRLHTEIPLLIGVLDNKNNLVRENAAYILWLMTGKDLGQDKAAWVDWYAKSESEGGAAASPKKVTPQGSGTGGKKH